MQIMKDLFHEKNSWWPFRTSIFQNMSNTKRREINDLIQGSMSVLEFELKFSSLGRYAPHIFNDPHRRLKKFVSGLRGNIRRFVVASDPKTFAKAVRIAHLTEDEHHKFLEEQKKAVKCPA